MDASKQFLKDNEILPRISFKESPVHTVTLEKDKLEAITNADGKEVTGVKYLVREDGEVKSFFTSSVTLVQKLSEFGAGDVVKITMKSLKGADGFKTTYDVAKVSKAETAPEKEVDPEETTEEVTKEEQELVDEIPF